VACRDADAHKQASSAAALVGAADTPGQSYLPLGSSSTMPNCELSSLDRAISIGCIAHDLFASVFDHLLVTAVGLFFIPDQV